jgi:hypothetical protein
MSNKKIIVGVINITIQPHKPEMYVSLFKDANRLKRPIRIKGDQHALLAGVYRLHREDDDKKVYTINGDIRKFTAIDPEADWINTSTGTFAPAESIADLNLPDEWKPNGSRFSYIFYPQEHLFFYEGYYDGKNLTPSTVESFIRQLLNQPELVEKYGVVDVTTIPEKDALDSALNMYHKERIELSITRPNPDTFENAEQKFLKRMHKQNLASIEQTMKAAKGLAIELDKDTETLARIAAKNGKVYIKGKDENDKPTDFSTNEHPLQEREYYNSKTTTPLETLEQIAIQLKDRIKNWLT